MDYLKGLLDFVVKLLKTAVKEPSVRAALVGLVVNALLQGWAALAPGLPAWIPDPSPLILQLGVYIELLLAGWAASAIRAVYLRLRAG